MTIEHLETDIFTQFHLLQQGNAVEQLTVEVPVDEQRDIAVVKELHVAEHVERPAVELHEVRALESFTVAGIEVMPIPVTHGRFAILGYRFGPLAYITDASFLSEEAFAALQGVKTLVLNALRKKPHPSHFSLEESIEAARRIGADDTYFIHFSHDIGLQARTEPTLPAGMHMAYDNLQIIW